MQKTATRTAESTMTGIVVVYEDETILHNGRTYEAICIDFSTILCQPLWDNSEHVALTKAIVDHRDLDDLFSFPKQAARPMPIMPIGTYSAIGVITSHYCWAPKSISGYKLYLSKQSGRLDKERVQCVVKTIIKFCGDKSDCDTVIVEYK